LIDKIDKLRPADGADRDQALPHLVLKTCFVEGAKLFQAAGILGMSERQLSRERARAINLLKAELEDVPDLPIGYRSEPIPTIRGFVARPKLSVALDNALELSHLVNVHGAPGVGKSSLVAEYASERSRDAPVLWYKVRPDVNDSAQAILFELAEYLAHHGRAELSSYVTAALPSLDLSLATRLAIKAIDATPHVFVFDDFHLVQDDLGISGLFDEMVARLPGVRIITVGRHRYSKSASGTALEVTTLNRTETRELLAHLSVKADLQMVRRLHSWTEGNTNLIKLAATWLKTSTAEEVAHGVQSFRKQAEVQEFLLNYATELLEGNDRALLQAASVFRDRFNDEALAFVSERTRGEIMDASMRLARSYIATRSRQGDSAFFHASVRDYIYDRLGADRRAGLHERCAVWYKRAGQDDEAEWHRRRATPAMDAR
jgi:ATP/maltotriose-dependent transcriptional regulator MalT